MSMCLRPVIEKWGPSMTFSSRDVQIGDIIEHLTDFAEVPDLVCSLNLYIDMIVVYISDGTAFCDWLAAADPVAVMELLAEEGVANADGEERERLTQDVTEICGLAEVWRRSIDPTDGSLRIYTD